MILLHTYQASIQHISILSLQRRRRRRRLYSSSQPTVQIHPLFTSSDPPPPPPTPTALLSLLSRFSSPLQQTLIYHRFILRTQHAITFQSSQRPAK